MVIFQPCIFDYLFHSWIITIKYYVSPRTHIHIYVLIQKRLGLSINEERERSMKSVHKIFLCRKHFFYAHSVLRLSQTFFRKIRKESSFSFTKKSNFLLVLSLYRGLAWALAFYFVKIFNVEVRGGVVDSYYAYVAKIYLDILATSMFIYGVLLALFLMLQMWYPMIFKTDGVPFKYGGDFCPLNIHFLWWFWVTRFPSLSR